MRIKKYKRIKNTIIAGASSGIMAGMLLMGGPNTTYAETLDPPAVGYTQNTSNKGMHIMHRWNSTTKINALASSLGLSQKKVEEEIRDGKTLKQILQSNGIVPEQIQKAYTAKKQGHKNWRRNLNKF